MITFLAAAILAPHPALARPVKSPVALMQGRPFQPLQVSLALPAGAVVIYLPSQVHRGEMFSGSVFGDPAGADWNAKNRSIEYLNSLTFKLGDMHMSIGASTFSLNAPMADAMILEIDDPNGKVLGKAELQLAAEPSTKINSFSSPYVVQAGMPLGITGPFNGDRNTTFADLAGKPAGILAEGKNECYLVSPVDHSGPTGLVVRKFGKRFEKKISVLGFTFMAPSEKLHEGGKGTLGVEIDGLQEVDPAAFPVLATLVIDNPKVLRFQGQSPAAYTLAITPADIVAGHVLRSVPIVAKGRGPYNITGSVSDSGSPQL